MPSLLSQTEYPALCAQHRCMGTSRLQGVMVLLPEKNNTVPENVSVGCSNVLKSKTFTILVSNETVAEIVTGT